MTNKAIITNLHLLTIHNTDYECIDSIGEYEKALTIAKEEPDEEAVIQVVLAINRHVMFEC